MKEQISGFELDIVCISCAGDITPAELNKEAYWTHVNTLWNDNIDTFMQLIVVNSSSAKIGDSQLALISIS